MTSLLTRWRASLRNVLWLDALQAAAISAAPVILAVLVHEPRLGWTAIAAFWACFGDPGGPLRKRAGSMLALGLIGALFCLLASASAAHLWLLLPLTFVCCTFGGLLRVLGPAAAIVGTLLSAGFVVAAELPAPTLMESLWYTLFFLAGAVWAILMTALVWRRRPWKDATHAVAHCYRGLADFSDALARMYSGLAPAAGQQAWTAVVKPQRSAQRAALEAARVRIREVLDARPSRRARAHQLMYLLDSAEDSFIALVAAADLLESNAPRWLGRSAGAHLSHALHRYASACNAIASTSDVSDAKQADCLRERLAHYNAGLRDLRGGAMAYAPDLATVVPVLDRLLHTAQAVSHTLFDQGAAPAAPAQRARDASGARQAWQTLRQNLRFESDAFRHAFRVGVGATIAVALSKTFAVNHGYWMSLTLVFILQPYFATTWQRTVERVIGSVAGAIGASLLGLLLSTPLSVALAVLPIALGTFAARTIHYALFTFFLTSQFVLVSHIQQPEIYEPMLAALRAFNSVLGGILALLVGFLVWPEKEPRQLAGALARALHRHADYALALTQEKSGDASSQDIVGLRRLACLSADNAEASLQRLQQNPVHRERNVDTAVNLLNAMRRITAAGTVLEIQPALPSASAAAAALRDYGAMLAHVLHPEGPTPPGDARRIGVPPVIADAEPALAAPLDRIAQQARQIRQLRERVQRDETAP
ncbi:FUSC family protein [Achromobacter sp. 77]|uniref:FUSC family protein n=1 Tax=Achromobacter TaxID=222 RepID=UPI001D0257E9|nr:FUSC family protein [Achromobacter sp. 77]MCU6616885.1 FUSC family protein [Achromobacter mucicolens]UDG78173.1 FUSC family protein [Achromobacter sp. 77]